MGKDDCRRGQQVFVTLLFIYSLVAGVLGGCRVRSFGPGAVDAKPELPQSLEKSSDAELTGGSIKVTNGQEKITAPVWENTIRGTPVLVIPQVGEALYGLFDRKTPQGTVLLVKELDSRLETQAGNVYAGKIIDEDEQSLLLLTRDCSVLRAQKLRIDGQKTVLLGTPFRKKSFPRTLESEAVTRLVSKLANGARVSLAVQTPLHGALVGGEVARLSLVGGGSLEGIFVGARQGCVLLEVARTASGRNGASGVRDGMASTLTSPPADAMLSTQESAVHAASVRYEWRAVPLSSIERAELQGEVSLLGVAKAGSSPRSAASTASLGGGNSTRTTSQWPGLQGFARQNGYVADCAHFARVGTDKSSNPSNGSPVAALPLHVSARSESAESIAATVLPLLLKEKVAHRVARRPAEFDARFVGVRRSEFITVFPRDAAHAARLARLIESALAPLNPTFWPSLGEKTLGRTGIVSTPWR